MPWELQKKTLSGTVLRGVDRVICSGRSCGREKRKGVVSRRNINEEVKHGHVPGAVRVLVRVVQDDSNTKNSRLLTFFLLL